MPSQSTPSVPDGYCQCGCGQRTNLYKGKPRRFIRGHHLRLWRFAAGETHPNYRTGQTTRDGYIIKNLPGGEQVRMHRWVMEQQLGRPLRPDEDVHHINGDKADNRIENLMVLPHGDHTRITKALNRWATKFDACVVCNSTARGHQAHGLCRRCYHYWQRYGTLHPRRIRF